MRKKITDIEFESVHSRDKQAGYLFGARFSKDRDNTVIFGCGAGRNEFKVFDNDTDGSGKYRELASFGNNSEPFLALDTAPNGRLVACGTSSGAIYISSYDIGVVDEELAEAQAKRERLKKATMASIGSTVGSTSAAAAAASAADD